MSDQETAPATSSSSDGGEAKLVPVGESIKYRRRAQQAESRCQQIEQQLKDLQGQLDCRGEALATADAQRDEAKTQLIVSENHRTAERMLLEAGVADLETACMLLGKRLDFGEDIEGQTLSRGVEQLLLDKPYLLKSASASLPPSTASAKPARPGGLAQLTRAADRAIQTGDRRDVAEYLRLRRQAAGAIRRSNGK
jgi:hypothetical protein